MRRREGGEGALLGGRVSEEHLRSVQRGIGMNGCQATSG